MISCSGVLISGDFLCKETRDLEAEAPDFIAEREGTRRPRGRFSESKIAMVANGAKKSQKVFLSTYRKRPVRSSVGKMVIISAPPGD